MEDNRFKSFIVFWISQSISQLGSGMTSFALIIWIYKQTNSAMSVSLMTFFLYLPYIAISIFAGPFIDSHRKKNIMLFSDSIAAICSMAVLILLLSGNLRISHIYIVNGIIGFMNAFQSPAETVAIGIIVPKENYAKANGMRSFSESLLMVFAPMMAGAVSSIFGLKGVILIDLITFIFAFVVLLFFVSVPETLEKTKEKHNSAFSGWKEGMMFLANHKGIMYLIISMAFMNFFSRLTYENILSPMILARSGGNDAVFGLVNGIIGVGGIIGGLIVSFNKITNDNLKLIYYSAAISFLFGDLLMGIGRSGLSWSIAAFAASFPIPFISVGQNVILYNYIPQHMQGRVFAVRNAVQFCAIPAGILLGGFLADYVFEPFMSSGNAGAMFLQKIVGAGAGSGMAVMFLCTGTLGFLTSVLWYRNKNIRSLGNSSK
ncbi:MAG: MFS transporter [Sedimentibacter sp.]|uniref:MFS transporter n=1 Tax=Sedimentibacter sp. TaxID=1960295 RepID=UPI0031585A6B